MDWRLNSALTDAAKAAAAAIPVLARAATDAVDQARAANILRLLELTSGSDDRRYELGQQQADVDEVRAALGLPRSLR